MSALLETRHVSKAYGAFRALDDVSIAVSAGELVSVVGPNGAGKTTLVNLLTGLMAPTSGDVLFMGKSIAGVGPVELADHGLARAFQLIQIFPQLTVAETIGAAVVSRQKKRWRLFSRLSADGAIGARVRDVADIFGLGHRLDTTAAAALAGREEIARRGIGVRARSPGHSAGRADLRGLHRRQARHHEHADRGGEKDRRAGHPAGRARHGPGGGLFASHHRPVGRARCWPTCRPPSSSPIRT